MLFHIFVTFYDWFVHNTKYGIYFSFIEVFLNFFPMKFPEIFANIRSKVLADKRILSGVVASIVAIVAVGGYFGYQRLAKRWDGP